MACGNGLPVRVVNVIFFLSVVHAAAHLISALQRKARFHELGDCRFFLLLVLVFRIKPETLKIWLMIKAYAAPVNPGAGIWK
jgi:hypothetical protein